MTSALSNILQAHRLIGQSCKQQGMLQKKDELPAPKCSLVPWAGSKGPRADEQGLTQCWFASGQTNIRASLLQGFLLSTRLLVTAVRTKQQKASPCIQIFRTCVYEKCPCANISSNTCSSEMCTPLRVSYKHAHTMNVLHSCHFALSLGSCTVGKDVNQLTSRLFWSSLGSSTLRKYNQTALDLEKKNTLPSSQTCLYPPEWELNALVCAWSIGALVLKIPTSENSTEIH